MDACAPVAESDVTKIILGDYALAVNAAKQENSKLTPGINANARSVARPGIKTTSGNRFITMRPRLIASSRAKSGASAARPPRKGISIETKPVRIAAGNFRPQKPSSTADCVSHGFTNDALRLEGIASVPVASRGDAHGNRRNGIALISSPAMTSSRG
jgi:hypothetical protein